MPDEPFTDEYLKSQVDDMAQRVKVAQGAVQQALYALAGAAAYDASQVIVVPPEAWEATYPAQARKVERVRMDLDNARHDLSAWAKARDKQLATRDTESPASSQNYIDTGNYLNVDEAEAASVEWLPSIADEFERMNALIGKTVLFRGEEAELTAIKQQAGAGVQVHVEYMHAPPDGSSRPDKAEGWSADVSEVPS